LIKEDRCEGAIPRETANGGPEVTSFYTPFFVSGTKTLKMAWVCPILTASGLSGQVKIFVEFGPGYRVFPKNQACDAGVYEWPVNPSLMHLLLRRQPRAFVELIMDSKCRIPVYLHATLSMPYNFIEGENPPIDPRLRNRGAAVLVESNLSANPKIWRVSVDGGEPQRSWGELHSQFDVSRSCLPIRLFADLIENDSDKPVLNSSQLQEQKGSRPKEIATAPPSAGIAELWF
jgi:hypothetical protein